MREELIVAIALVISGFFSRFMYKHIMNNGTKNQGFIENAKKNGHYTEGKCDSSKVLFGNPDSSNIHLRSNSLRVRYQYRVNGKVYYKKMTFQSPGKVSIDFPICTTVYYDPNNPKKAVCPEEATKTQQLRTAGLSSIGLYILSLFVIFHVLRLFLA